MICISIHAPREGGRHRQFMAKAPDARISIHAPREGGDSRPSTQWMAIFLFQSTPPARGATSPQIVAKLCFPISIHAPREGGDLRTVLLGLDGLISIHAPREGGDYSPGRGVPVPRHFNPRPPRGGRPSLLQCIIIFTKSFQSTPPARGATNSIHRNNTQATISIHAPREGGDQHTSATSRPSATFQSTPPARGATPQI